MREFFAMERIFILSLPQPPSESFDVGRANVVHDYPNESWHEIGAQMFLRVIKETVKVVSTSRLAYN